MTDVTTAIPRAVTTPAAPAYRYSVGDHVVFTNVFGVCWGVKTITALDERGGPTYHYVPTDTPWFSVAERHLAPADDEDRIMDLWASEAERWAYFQDKYGFTPNDTFGCW